MSQQRIRPRTPLSPSLCHRDVLSQYDLFSAVRGPDHRGPDGHADYKPVSELLKILFTARIRYVIWGEEVERLRSGCQVCREPLDPHGEEFARLCVMSVPQQVWVDLKHYRTHLAEALLVVMCQRPRDHALFGGLPALDASIHALFEPTVKRAQQFFTLGTLTTETPINWDVYTAT